MSKMTREEKLFRNENSILEHYQQMVAQDNPHEETTKALKNLTNRYKALLDQTRFLTWISGRLERKLQRSNRELHENNQTLQNTLNELTKAQAGKSAYAIIYFIAIILFVLEEFFVGPFVNVFGESVGYSILIKLGIVLLLKVSEGFIEKKIHHVRQLRLLRRQRKKQTTSATPEEERVQERILVSRNQPIVLPQQN